MNNPQHITKEHFSLAYLCETGGVQSIANDLSADDKKKGLKMNTSKMTLQTFITTAFHERHNFMMTLWSSQDIEEDAEIFHTYDAGYWNRMKVFLQSATEAVKDMLGRWWKPQYDEQSECQEDYKVELWKSQAG